MPGGAAGAAAGGERDGAAAPCDALTRGPARGSDAAAGTGSDAAAARSGADTFQAVKISLIH